MGTIVTYTVDGSDTEHGEKADADHGHTSPDVTDLVEAVHDIVNGLIVAGTNVSKAYNDAGDTLTISATPGAGSDPESVRDTIAAAVVAGANIDVNVDDPGDTITFSVTGLTIADVANLQAALDNHVHSAGSITSGTLDVARLGTSGTRAAGWALEGDGVWRAVGGGGNAAATLAIFETSPGVYPLRNTVTSDQSVLVFWRGTNPPTIGGGYAVNGVDVWLGQ